MQTEDNGLSVCIFMQSNISKINNILIKADIICSSLVDHHGKVAQVLTPMIGYVEYEDYR